MGKQVGTMRMAREWKLFTACYGVWKIVSRMSVDIHQDFFSEFIFKIIYSQVL